MKYTIRTMNMQDREAVIDIFNYYVENSFAAYPEMKLPYQAFEMFLKMSENLPAVSIIRPEDKVVGFGMLKKFNPLPNFSHTVEIAYFIDRDHTGKGLGRMVLDHLETEGAKTGVTNILASISSLNQGSINFHAKNGFIHTGVFRNAGKKKGQLFDIVWMQKVI